jgi:2-desacetyl-2-hydroxyethyl bacteriochlorophyllide A dehydrogenase
VDRTQDIAIAGGARVVRVRSEDFTFGHSLNVGIEAARGQFIAIISAHAIPTSEEWLELLIEPLRKEESAMVYGCQRGHARSKFSEARDFERVYGIDSRRITPPHYFANNANSAVRRDLWELHKFDERLPGLEDIAWAKHWMDLGKVVHYVSDASIYHIHEESWAQVRHRYHREGVAARSVGIRGARHIPLEIIRELAWCLDDLRQGVRFMQFGVLREIVRFRYEKTFGTVRGILDVQSIAKTISRKEMNLNKQVRAVVIRGPHQAELEDRPFPTLKPGEILVRVAFQGICATDLEILEGSLGYYKSGVAKYPIVPGHEFSGTIAAVGARITEFTEGDRVVVECIQGCGQCGNCAEDRAIACKSRRELGVIGIDGGYQTYMVARARYAHKVPDDVTLAEAALAEPLAVVLKALRRLGATADHGEKMNCAVVGAGTIGNLSASVLELYGHRVTVFDRDARRLERIGGQIRKKITLEGLNEFDWIIEATGDQRVLESLLRESAVGATLLLLGFPYAVEPFTFESIVAYDRTVIGSVGSSSKDFADALSILRSIDTSEFLTARIPFEEYEDAWDMVRSREHLKVMLTLDATVA